MRLLRIALVGLALLAPASMLRAAGDAPGLNLEINGLKPGLEDAVRSGLTLQQYRDRAVSEAQLRRLVSRVERDSSRISGRRRWTISAIESRRWTPARLMPASSTRRLMSLMRSISSCE